jgi:rhodanese-related sulfurtransferase
MPLQDFKVLWQRDAVLVVDVRDEESYRAGHIPHAVSIPLDDLGEHLAQLQQEPRPIVTYCS